MDQEKFKNAMTLEIEAIEQIQERLKWIKSVARNCDMDTDGEKLAFVDSVREVVSADIEALGEIIGTLKDLSQFGEGGAV